VLRVGYLLETDRYFFSPIFSIFFTDIWPVNILLTTDTDIPKFAYRYFTKVFWFKLVRIAYTSFYCSSNINQYKCIYVTAEIAKQYFTGKT